MIFAGPGGSQHETVKASLRGWMIWFVAALFYLYEFFVRVAPSTMEPELQSAFHLTAAALGAGYQRQWTSPLSSTFSVGHISVESATFDELDPFTIGSSLYSSANLMWQITPQFMAGVEYLYGWREARNDASGDVSRGQMTLRYTFDDALGGLFGPR
jgi:hypothetical protein